VHVAGVLAEPVLKPTALEPKAFGRNIEREGEGRHHTLSCVRRGRPAVGGPIGRGAADGGLGPTLRACAFEAAIVAMNIRCQCFCIVPWIVRCKNGPILRYPTMQLSD
jgi:hypothetical protein